MVVQSYLPSQVCGHLSYSPSATKDINKGATLWKTHVFGNLRYNPSFRSDVAKGHCALSIPRLPPKRHVAIFSLYPEHYCLRFCLLSSKPSFNSSPMVMPWLTAYPLNS